MTGRMLKAHEGGFIQYWTDGNVADASRCLSSLGRNQRQSDRVRLALGGLSGAFVVLAFGYGLSTVAFFSEMIYQRC